MAISERPVVDAILLAVEEINAHGGLLGDLCRVFNVMVNPTNTCLLGRRKS
jgi:ABC-type branched-subunit amino acid transport system substrate-binding protein